MDWIEHRVEGPPSIFYVPEFITESDEKYLMEQVAQAPKPKWTQLSNRRLQNWGGIPHPRGMVAEDIPDWLRKYMKKVEGLDLFNGKVPNHCLVNEYQPGQGIMPHLDGSLFHPTITTVNLGSHSMLNFYTPLPKDTSVQQADSRKTDFKQRYKFSLFLEPRSLLVLQDECYTTLLHGIDEITSDLVTDKVLNLKHITTATVGDVVDRGTRVSLTIRFVPKTTKPIIKLNRK